MDADITAQQKMMRKSLINVEVVIKNQESWKDSDGINLQINDDKIQERSESFQIKKNKGPKPNSQNVASINPEPAKNRKCC